MPTAHKAYSGSYVVVVRRLQLRTPSIDEVCSALLRGDVLW